MGKFCLGALADGDFGAKGSQIWHNRGTGNGLARIDGGAPMLNPSTSVASLKFHGVKLNVALACRVVHRLLLTFSRGRLHELKL